MTRVAAALTLVLVATGGAATVFAPTASANAQERITVNPDQTVALDYPALVGTGQAQEFVDPTIAFDPATCESVTYCDEIPITIAPPATDLSSSDYTVQILVSWDTAVVAVPVNGNTDSNDIDIAIWDDPVVPDSGPDGNGIRQYSATGNVPEQINLVDASGNFNLVVLNASGINHGYHLVVSWKTQLLSKPFESLPSDYSSTGSLTPAAPASRLALGGSAAPVAAPVTPGASSGAALPALPAAPDTAFAAPSASNFQNQLGDQSLVNSRPAAAKRELKAPSNLALLLWLLALPFGIMAIGGQLLLGRSRALLRL
jgi:hypothetical protein